MIVFIKNGNCFCGLAWRNRIDDLIVSQEKNLILVSVLELLYRFHNCTKGVDAALMKTGMVFFDYESQQAVSVPEKFRKKFA